ncbi:MAG: PilZ domain-containing protein [Candidatus Omnitrophica bacterium]|nr:PilZ domain-containing protein [Candidatus Omnitrophota bacterium]
MKERRFVRLRINMDVSYRKLFDFDEDCPKTCDVSEDGLCLNLPERLSIDRHIELALRVPDEEPITVRGRVVWTRGDEPQKSFLTGLQFVEISEEARERLKAYAHANCVKG